MRPRGFFLLLVAFFIFLYIGPVNLAPSSAPSAIPTEQNILSDEPMIGSRSLLERGSSVYLGNGQYQYDAVLGEYNTWNGLEYVRYLYDDITHNATFAGHSIVLYDWYATFSDTAQTLVDDMRFIVQYWREQGGGSWRELDLYDHSFLPAVETENTLKFGQSFTDYTATLDVFYYIHNSDQIKILLNFTTDTTRLYRFVWMFTGVDGELIEGNKSLSFDDVNIGWDDAELNATYDWTVATKKCDITFDNITVNAGETYTLDPSVHPVLGADINDDWWRQDEDGPTYWTHYTSSADIYVHYNSPNYCDYGQYRFSLAIDQGVTIDSADVTVWELADTGGIAATIWRIDETNVGSLEADVTAPIRSNVSTSTHTFDSNAAEWVTDNVTDLVQEQVNIGGWVSGNYMAFRWGQNGNNWNKFEDYQHGDSHQPYMNVTYTEAGVNNIPSNDGSVLTNPSDTDNLYAAYQEYLFTSNVSDADGFADIDYIELSAYSGSSYWTVRYDEDTDTFSEELGASYIVLGGSSSATEAGNDIDVTWYIEIDWSHSDLTNYDLRQYVVDDEPESDTDDYDLNYDYETRVDITTGPTLSDGSGTVDRGDYDTLDGITATGTIDYYNSAISPDSGDVDVWVSCADVAGGPWSDTTLTAGAFSVTVDSDDVVGLDTYNFKVVEEGAGSGGADLCQSSESDTYIADRMVITITADSNSVVNGTQVNFTVSVIYDYDDSAFSYWNISVTNDGSPFGVFDHTSTNFNDTDADTTNIYTADAFNNETTHAITEFTSNSESVTWSAEGAPPTTPITDSMLYQLFLSTNMWGYLGPLALVIGGYFVMRKDKALGVMWFVVECLVLAQYFLLVSATPDYWWHIFILLLGGLFTCVFPLWDR